MDIEPLSFTGPTRVVVTFGAQSGVARDACMTDWTFSSPTPNVLTALQAFYNATHVTWATAVNAYLSPSISRAANGCVFHVYDMSGPLSGLGPMGPPIQTSTWQLGGGGGLPLPSELAVVLSYHASDTSIPEHGTGTRPRSRYRGRIYVGPLQQSALAQDSTTHRATVTTAVRETLTASAVSLLAAEPTWSVWSRKDKVLRPVVGGWVDDAWDIQRRRGEDPLVRTNWP
jgi:hypothetical protein